jgi:hypothetical protein
MDSLFKVKFNWGLFAGIAFLVFVLFPDLSIYSFLAIIISIHQFLLLFYSINTVIPVRYLFGTLCVCRCLSGPPLLIMDWININMLIL